MITRPDSPSADAGLRDTITGTSRGVALTARTHRHDRIFAAGPVAVPGSVRCP
jgi:hypothetical protein